MEICDVSSSLKLKYLSIQISPAWLSQNCIDIIINICSWSHDLVHNNYTYILNKSSGPHLVLTFAWIKKGENYKQWTVQSLQCAATITIAIDSLCLSLYLQI